jgi:tRNA 2-thiouridine synthesizing protein A
MCWPRMSASPERDGMIPIKLDLTGLKCPLPALRTAKALKSLSPGAVLEVHCTDPLSVIDIPNLARKTGDMITIMERTERRIIFLIEKANRSIEDANVPSSGGQRSA